MKGMIAMNALEIKNLCKSYGEFSLDNINLTLPCGCITGLIGENGAGKSTVIKLILDMIHRDSGTITLFGKDSVQSFPASKEDIGIVPDEIGLPGCLTVKQVDKIMRLTFKNWDSAVFFDYIKKFDIPESKPFKDFSRGTKMKTGIAIALSHKAKLLILDEATNGLDPVVRDEVVDMLCDFTRDESHSILISSHIVSDLEKICDYIAFLHKGKLLMCEEKDRLYEEYGIIRCDLAVFKYIPAHSVIGKKSTPYGTEAIVKRADVPENIEIFPINIEELFIFMVKEN